jgi:hypothetical protein
MSFTTKAATLGPGGVAFDTSEKLTAEQYAELYALGFRIGVRTVGNALQNPAYGISSAELQAAVTAKLGMMLYQFPRTSNWSATTGAADGTAAAHNALAIGFPKTACLWADLEGAIPSAAAMIDYVNAWYQAAVSAGMAGSALGIYVGPGVPLTPQQLYENLFVARYWRAGAIVPDVASRGYQFIQAYPGNAVVLPGVVIDYDYVLEDFHGSIPVVCVSAAT